MPLVAARPPTPVSLAVSAGGTTRAARRGAASTMASGCPVRAGGSGRRHDFPGRSVGTAEAPGPSPPPSDVRFLWPFEPGAALFPISIRAAARWRGGALSSDARGAVYLLRTA